MDGYSIHDAVEYECEECDVFITGRSPDPQASPQLACPECEEEMTFRMMSNVTHMGE